MAMQCRCAQSSGSSLCLLALPLRLPEEWIDPLGTRDSCLPIAATPDGGEIMLRVALSSRPGANRCKGFGGGGEAVNTSPAQAPRSAVAFDTM